MENQPQTSQQQQDPSQQFQQQPQYNMDPNQFGQQQQQPFMQAGFPQMMDPNMLMQMQMQQMYPQQQQFGGQGFGMNVGGGYGQQNMGGGGYNKFNKAQDPQKYKTVMCRHFEAHGSCTLGEKCSFAHGQHELRKFNDPVPNEYQPRPQFHSGGRGGHHHSRGGHHHGGDDRHHGSGSGNFKTAVCKNFNNGNCRYGDNCSFAHGEHELRKGSAPQNSGYGYQQPPPMPFPGGIQGAPTMGMDMSFPVIGGMNYGGVQPGFMGGMPNAGGDQSQQQPSGQFEQQIQPNSQ